MTIVMQWLLPGVLYNVYLCITLTLRSALFHQALQMLESRLKLLSGETALSVEQKIAEVQESVRKAKVLVSESVSSL